MKARRAVGGPRGPWLARNRLWLMLLVPLLLLAAAATSFRLQRIYLPWDWTRAHATRGSSLTLEQDVFLTRDQRHHRKVDITVVGVTPAREVEGGVAGPGTDLYRVSIELSAAPDVMLEGCEVGLLGPDGSRYDSYVGQQDAPGFRGYRSRLLSCVPEDAPGPGWDYLSNEPRPAKVERPRTWRIVTGVAVPHGVAPDRVTIRWSKPDYAVLAIPS